VNRWYFWVLAPIMVASAVLIPLVGRPATLAGHVVGYAVSAMLLLAALGLANSIRFHWALRAVAAGIVLLGLAYFVVELRMWLDGARIERGGRERPSLWSAVGFLVVFGYPALGFMRKGRSDTIVDVITTERREPPRPRSRLRPPHYDMVLHTIEWDDEERIWVVPPAQQGMFSIKLGGDERPHAKLIPHARDLFTNPSILLSAVPMALEAAARQVPEAAREIYGLRVVAVELLWPDAPDDGVVRFEGPGTDERSWRADYLGRRLGPLAFDD
jgi:hypothetical protein